MLFLCAIMIIPDNNKSVKENFRGGDGMFNQDIRRMAAGNGVRLWQIAEALGIADCSLSRKMRKELSQNEKEKIARIIREISKEAE